MKIDYLVCRIVDFTDDDYQKLMDFLQLSAQDFQHFSGRYYVRYNRMWSFQNIVFIYWSDDYNEILLKFTGEGLEYLYRVNSEFERNIIYSYFNPVVSLSFMFSGRINYTRMDLAIDTDNKELVEKVIYKVRNGEYTSVSKNRVEYQKYNGGKVSGWTIYLGSFKSDRLMRIYDKAAELGIDDYLVRFELQLKRDWADITASLILAGKYDDILSMFNDLLTIRDKTGNNNTNKSMWKVSYFWVEFLKTSKKRIVKLKRAKKTIVNFIAYVRQNLARRLKEAFEFDNALFDYIQSQVLSDFELQRLNSTYRVVSVLDDWVEF